MLGFYFLTAHLLGLLQQHASCSPPSIHSHARRFNKAADLINEVLAGYFDSLDVRDALARVYVWLRYSSTRKRNYNTQPRILSAAQERLTNTIARAHASTSGEPVL